MPVRPIWRDPPRPAKKRSARPSGEGARTSQDLSQRASALDQVERVAKVTGVIGAFGYMAFRAHLNHLGLTSMTSLGLERYLMEAWALVVDLLVPAVVGLLVLLVLYVLWQFILRLTRFQGLLEAADPHTLAVGGLVLVALVALSATLYLHYLLDVSGGASSVAVGRLVPENLEPGPPPIVFYLALACCILAYLACGAGWASPARQSGTGSPGGNHPSWYLAAFSVVLLALTLPLVYGRFAYPPLYPLVQVERSDMAAVSPLCGLLVLETGEALEIWYAADGLGHAVVIPREGVEQLTVDTLADLLATASMAASEASAPQPSCPSLQ
jgi:hypothetical protein